jgi:hypothetical protein
VDVEKSDAEGEEGRTSKGRWRTGTAESGGESGSLTSGEGS